MKKLLTAAIVLALSLAFTACGPDGEGSSVNSQDVAGTLPTEDVNVSDSSDSGILPETTAESDIEPVVTSAPETAPTEALTTQTPTTVSEASTAATTTKAPETTVNQTSATTTAATTASQASEADGETEELGEWEDIPNLDEFLANLGIEDGDLE